MSDKPLHRVARTAMVAAAVMASSFSVATQASAVEVSVDLYFFEISQEVCITTKDGVKHCQVTSLT